MTYVMTPGVTGNAVFASAQQPGPWASGYVSPNQGQGALASSPAPALPAAE
jgi:hypothetical protein